MTTIERIADTRAGTGEGPLWHPEENALYWVDIPAGLLYRYDPETGENTVAYETDDGSPLGGFTIEEDGSLLLFEHGLVCRWKPQSTEAEPIIRVDADTRFNDVIADPEGRVFCGTMPGENDLGDLYRVDPDGSVRIVIEDVDIPNGMGFSSDLETFYFTESEANRIDTFDYDRDTGEISNRQPFVETPTDDGVPDGLTVDEDGFVWSARWNGNRIVRYDSDGTAVAEIELPARKVSSITFGEPAYTDCYVTTALDGGTRASEGDGAGALFRVRFPEIDAAGVAEFRSRIGLE
ncbi:SMP-30/gluconolactonase/LRE family protein [Halostagnicola larsenii]|uniref:SMP-30/gluconolactonase/LRE family protein n=1 Tax=Halostagnicola larsenii TaxID=353800 RepID=UPI0006794A35|nr:SMP-30/gluconolactonase/LRE family protein [Halostagnicola larsenii]